MVCRIQVGELQVSAILHDFINTEALPGTGIGQMAFWSGFDKLIHEFSPRNGTLLETRQTL